MTLTIKSVTSDLIDDLGRLFSTDKVADQCWCMWFIIPVKEFHSVSHEGNRSSFCELAASSEQPLGLLAYQNDEPVGWCAVGPRSRYVRALKTPTYKGGEAGDDSDIWLVPCFFVRKDMRGAGVTRSLLEAAVKLAKENGAAAIEGFPFAGAKKRSSGDIQVGSERLFSSCGFEVIRTPSTSRVVMRRELKGSSRLVRIDQKNEMPQELIVVKSVEIATSASHVWRALTESDQISQWMAGAHVESNWKLGSDITFSGTMPNFNKKYRDHGTVIAIEREKLLQYSHWSQMTRLQDLPQNRTIITFILESIYEKTRLTMRQENFHSEVQYKHANFFWGVALHVMKNLLEQTD